MTTPSYVDDRFPGPDPYAPLKDLPSFPLTSTDFVDGDRLPDELCGPDGRSPQLAWSGIPSEAKSLAVSVYDPDAPTAAGYWHWAVFNIPVSTNELPASAGAKPGLGIDGAISLRGDSGSNKYYGPNPPKGHGPHRYLYAVHAVDVERLDVPADATPTVLGFNLYFHSIARAILWGWAEN